MFYKEERIELTERQAFAVDADNQDYTVSRQGGLIFSASTRFGTAYATQSEQALSDAMTIIDRNLDPQ